jgi:cyclophilin family peptidyl-prolyl cis-trans isomerase
VQGLTYKNSPIHRVVQGGWIQGGDILSGSGAEGTSVFGTAAFEDETFDVKFDKPGVLAMASSGPHTNGSQFFVTLAVLPWLNCRAVGFGRVISGFAAVERLQELPALNERPVKDVKIVSCGALKAEDLCLS